MENIGKLIGLNIKRRRESLGLTQSDLADLAKSSITTINRIEKGHQMPHPETLSAVAIALNVKESDLYIDPSTALKGEKPASNQSRAELILEIQAALASLNDDQLRSILALVNEIRSLSSTSDEQTG